MEQVLYNAGLAPVNIDQDRFFYCNPLQWNVDRQPTHKHRTSERWLIHSCYCCPPQMARTLSALQTWAYSVGDRGVWVNLYGGSKLNTTLANETVRLTQTTDYPWQGHVRIRIDACPARRFSLMLRIPGWCTHAKITINDRPHTDVPAGGVYAALNRAWKPGDVVELDLSMPTRLVEANPNVLTHRNRVAVMRGPLVYCLELPIGEGGREIWNGGVFLPENTDFTQRFDEDLLGGIVTLTCDALTRAGKERFVRQILAKSAPPQDSRSWKETLYRPLRGRNLRRPQAGTVRVTLIPYFVWANRGEAYMQVWTPLAR
jgi:DUF1680 family protein